MLQDAATTSKKGPRKIVAFPRIVGQIDFLAAKNSFWGGRLESRVVQLPKGSWSRGTATKLYSFGTRFLYGMLHRYMLDFSDGVKDSVPELLYNRRDALQQSNTYTIALHSRHPNGLDGCKIKSEKKCIRKILKNKPEGMPCKVWVLADRKCTISTLSNWLQLKAQCSVEVATHEMGTGTRDEHGPFAGKFTGIHVLQIGETSLTRFRRSEQSVSHMPPKCWIIATLLFIPRCRFLPGRGVGTIESATRCHRVSRSDPSDADVIEFTVRADGISETDGGVARRTRCDANRRRRSVHTGYPPKVSGTIGTLQSWTPCSSEIECWIQTVHSSCELVELENS